MTYTFKLRDDVKFHNGNAVDGRRRRVELEPLPQAADTKWTCAG
ncbi:hypothetical protein [Ensifer canadensis]